MYVQTATEWSLCCVNSRPAGVRGRDSHNLGTTHLPSPVQDKGSGRATVRLTLFPLVSQAFMHMCENGCNCRAVNRNSMRDYWSADSASSIVSTTNSGLLDIF